MSLWWGQVINRLHKDLLQLTTAGISIKQGLLLVQCLPLTDSPFSRPIGKQHHDNGQSQYNDSNDTGNKYFVLRVIEHQRVLQLVLYGYQVSMLLHQLFSCGRNRPYILAHHQYALQCIFLFIRFPGQYVQSQLYDLSTSRRIDIAGYLMTELNIFEAFARHTIYAHNPDLSLRMSFHNCLINACSHAVVVAEHNVGQTPCRYLLLRNMIGSFRTPVARAPNIVQFVVPLHGLRETLMALFCRRTAHRSRNLQHQRPVSLRNHAFGYIDGINA